MRSDVDVRSEEPKGRQAAKRNEIARNPRIGITCRQYQKSPYYLGPSPRGPSQSETVKLDRERERGKDRASGRKDN